MCATCNTRTSYIRVQYNYTYFDIIYIIISKWLYNYNNVSFWLFLATWLFEPQRKQHETYKKIKVTLKLETWNLILFSRSTYCTESWADFCMASGVEWRRNHVHTLSFHLKLKLSHFVYSIRRYWVTNVVKSALDTNLLTCWSFWFFFQFILRGETKLTSNYRGWTANTLMNPQISSILSRII